MTWNFRLTKKEIDGEIMWGVVEYYQKIESADGWTEDSVIGWFETEEEVIWYIKTMLENVQRRVFRELLDQTKDV